MLKGLTVEAGFQRASACLFILLSLLCQTGYHGTAESLQISCEFVPHIGGASSEADLGIVTVLSNEGYYQSPITYGAIDAEIGESSVIFSDLIVKSESITVNDSETGEMKFFIGMPTIGKFNPEQAHQAIQIELQLFVEFTELESVYEINVHFKGQLEVSPEGKALAGQIKLDSPRDLPPFGEIQLLIIRVFCVYE